MGGAALVSMNVFLINLATEPSCKSIDGDHIGITGVGSSMKWPESRLRGPSSWNLARRSLSIPLPSTATGPTGDGNAIFAATSSEDTLWGPLEVERVVLAGVVHFPRLSMLNAPQSVS